ncbi:MAG: hypothetical protein KA716_33425 [Gloeotrichia echinulata DEX184]
MNNQLFGLLFVLVALLIFTLWQQQNQYFQLKIEVQYGHGRQ